MLTKVGGSEISKVFTIGHSNQSADELFALLAKHGIDTVVDVRSKPRSRFFPHFNRKSLETSLTDLGIAYIYLGKHLGGHPDDDDLYDDGRVVYERISILPEFRRDIRRVVDESQQHCLVLMCAEEDPEECHRHPLLALELLERDVQVLHLRRNGSVKDAKRMQEETSLQMPLVEPAGEDLTWRSPKRIR